MIKKYYYLIYREIKMMTTYKSLLLTIILTPSVYLLLFSLSLSSNIKYIYYLGKQLPYLTFIIPGMLSMQSFSQESFCLMKTSNDKRFGMIRMLLTNDISIYQYFISRILGSFLIVIFQCILVILIGIIVFKIHYFISLINILLIIFLIFVATYFWSMIGLLLGIISKNESTRDVLQTVIPLPILFASSIFYDINKAPCIIKIISKINPLSIFCDTLRDIMCLNIVNYIKIIILIFLICILSIINIIVSNKIDLLSY